VSGVLDEGGEDADDAPYVMRAYVKLLVADAARARRFYEVLGFTCRHADQVFTHLRRGRHVDLFLVSAPPGMPLPPARGAGVIVCVSVEPDELATLATLARSAGATVDGPRAQPWNTNEVVVTDPEGYRIAFVAPA
jgi:lactoylglutathione lyase